MNVPLGWQHLCPCNTNSVDTSSPATTHTIDLTHVHLCSLCLPSSLSLSSLSPGSQSLSSLPYTVCLCLCVVVGMCTLIPLYTECCAGHASTLLLSKRLRSHGCWGWTPVQDHYRGTSVWRQAWHRTTYPLSPQTSQAVNHLIIQQQIIKIYRIPNEKKNVSVWMFPYSNMVMSLLKWNHCWQERSWNVNKDATLIRW